MLATVPPLWVKVKEPANPDPEEVETSKPVGAVTVIFDIKPLPDAEKLCSAETAPEHEVKPVKLEGETLIVPVKGVPSYAPIEGGFALVDPSKSVAGAPVAVPAPVQGEQF